MADTPRPQRQSVKPLVEEKEEVSILAMYKEMLKRVEEVNKISLTMESSDDLAVMLKDVEMVKMRIQSIMEKFAMQQEMERVAKEYEEKEVKNDTD